ncbi:class A sortase [Streptococcus danieliae]|nr:class A sortase [Streptococcus danieliae]MBF0717496.1 class A sortase [Streptococcus danieliae]MCU0082766.1 class A sortase [Streptococcus danieliae]NYS33427.1 class A sortase [Streptococcus danieliae]NYS49426.1 class A sortase [Streptococcus danieliae]
MAKNKKKTRNWPRYLLAGILFIVALGLIFNSSIRNMIMVYHTNQYQVAKVSKEKIEENKAAEANFDFQSVEALSTERVLEAQMNQQELPVIGGIAIPDLSVNLPIFKGLANEVLYYGAGTMKADQVMGKGNYSLASHHVFGITGANQMLFSPLENAQNGMKIYLTDKDKVYTYTIKSVETVTPDRIDVIQDTEGVNELTLVTCEDAAAVYRTIVKADLTEESDFNSTNPEVLKAFESSYNQMQL